MCGARFEGRCATRHSRLRRDERRLYGFVPFDLVYRDRTGEIYRVRYNPTHRWFYVPEMRVDDGDPDKMLRFGPGKARFTAHSTFEDLAAPVDVLPRESIELRTLVFHVS
jgi:hypothetical protein